MFTFVSKSFCPSAFKRHFLSPIGNKKAHRPCINFSSTFKRSVYRFLYPLFQNHFLLVRLIRRIPQPWGKYQQNGKQTYCRLPPQSFRITLKDTLSHISMKSWGFYLSKIFLEFFSNMHIPPPPPLPLPSRRKLLISPEQRFLGIYFFPAEGELWSAKNDQN